MRDLRELGCDVLVVDLSAKGRHVGQQLGAVSAFEELSQCPTHQVDGVVIAAPTTLHVPLAMDALGLGVPVFVEKPLADDVEPARMLVDAGGDRLFVMHKWHYHPGIEMLADLSASGRLGRVNGITSERTGPANPSHDIDAVWLLAPHEITIGHRILGTFPDVVAGAADVVGGEAVGIEALTRWSTGAWHRWSMSVRPAGTRRRVVVHGTEAVAALDDPYSTHVALRRDGSSGTSEELVPISDEPPLLRELRAFRDHVLGGPPPPTPARDGLAVVELIAALRRDAGLPLSSTAPDKPCEVTR